MRKNTHRFATNLLTLLFALVVFQSLHAKSKDPEVIGSSLDPTQLLWYDHPGQHAINEGLPIGNGRIGMLIPGDVAHERIVLNEDSVWSGHFCENANNPQAATSLPAIRKLLFEGKVKEANELILQTQVPGEKPNDPRVGGAYGTYQMLAALHLEFPHKTFQNYRRQLDLQRAIATVRYESDGVVYTREHLSSHPDQVMAIRLTADKEKHLNFKIALKRPQSLIRVSNPSSNALLLEGQMQESVGNEGLRYAAFLKVETEGGKTTYTDNSLSIENADSAVIFVAAATNYSGLLAWPDYLNSTNPSTTTQKQIEEASIHHWNKLLQRHIADYQQLNNRVKFSLSSSETENNNPTDKRLQQIIEGGEDPILTQLYFNLGKYLLISSSRPGSLPANLQGIWSDASWDETQQKWNYFTPWNGDYHTNINIQMNYWPVHVLNLSECAEPLNDLIQGMVKPGTETARVQHNCDGWTVHTLHNIWGSTTAGGWATWGHFPMAGPWMTAHLWEHFLFTQDKAFLSSVWPTIKGSADFVMDWLVEDPESGLLVSGPSASPENRYTLPDGTEGFFCMAPTMDQMIAWQILTIADTTQHLLLDPENHTDRYQKTLQRLKGPKIGPDGRLLEWAQPYGEPEPGHRHVSHLYGLHPSNQLTLEHTPELTEAARKSLEYRIAHGGAYTGWSRAWVINFWARFHDGQQAHHHLLELYRHSTLPNLFDSHPPFQIDGNFGATAGICEMLLQSHETDDNGKPLLRLLPALPSKSWPTGRMTGIKARNNITVGLQWADGKLVQATFNSPIKQTITVSYAGNKQTVEISANNPTIYPL